MAFNETGNKEMTRFHVGTMGWSYSFWVNNFYPAKTKPENFLEEYSKHFSTVEVNSSFYRAPSESTLENWKKQTPQNFLFSLKVPKKVTHENMADDYLDYFLNKVNLLEGKLGPLLFQFPPSFKPERFDYLEDIVSVLPKSHRYAVEVRNKSWLDDHFYDMLEDNNVALVLGDSPWLHGVWRATADFVYLRWEGNRKQIKGTLGKVEKDRSSNTKEWAQKISSFSGIDVFGYFSKYYSGHPPTDAKQFLEYLTSE